MEFPLQHLQHRISPHHCQMILAALRERERDSFVLQILELLNSDDLKTAENAAYLYTYLTPEETRQLEPYLDRCVTIVFQARSARMQRLTLTFMSHFFTHHGVPTLSPTLLRLYDFCLSKLSTPDNTALPALAAKTAEQLSRSIPELREELRVILDCLDEEDLIPSLRSARQYVLTQIRKTQR